jgi:hypothetical protein
MFPAANIAIVTTHGGQTFSRPCDIAGQAGRFRSAANHDPMAQASENNSKSRFGCGIGIVAMILTISRVWVPMNRC